jgi:hypothetical protein
MRRKGTPVKYLFVEAVYQMLTLAVERKQTFIY